MRWLRWQAKEALRRFLFWLAWRLPKQLVYFASVRLMSVATTGQYSQTEVPSLTAIEALRRWEKGA